MEKFIPAFRKKLQDDPVVSELASTVRYWRAPREPERLIKPVVVFNVNNFQGKPETHGGASTPQILVDIWGYDNEGSQIIEATKLASRILNIVSMSRLEVEGGGTTRISANTGFQVVNEQDPNTIHLQARFITSYWSKDRIELLNE